LLLSTTSSLARPLNPSPHPSESESELDRYFRIAFESATATDFNTSIVNYRRAATTAIDPCDRQHAQAGVQAATEALAYFRRVPDGLPTQQFAYRLRRLTIPLRCVTVR
jgi:hypothetical protein